MCLLLLFSLLYSVAGAFFLSSFISSLWSSVIFFCCCFSSVFFIECLAYISRPYATMGAATHCCWSACWLCEMYLRTDYWITILLFCSLAFIRKRFSSLKAFRYLNIEEDTVAILYATFLHFNIGFFSLSLGVSSCHWFSLRRMFGVHRLPFFSEFRVANDLLKYIGVNPAAQQTHTRTGTQTRP